MPMANYGLIVCATVLLKSCLAQPPASYECMSAGVTRSWWVVYKPERDQTSANPLLRAGVGFYSMHNAEQRWTMDILPIDIGNNQPVGDTLAQYYNDRNRNDAFAVFYNPEPPGWMPDQQCSCSGVPSDAKGVILGKSRGFIFLVHTVPQFPSPLSYSWPTNAELSRSDMLMCLSVTDQDLETISSALHFGSAFLYHQNVPTAVVSTLGPNTRRFLTQQPITRTPFRATGSLRTITVDRTSFPIRVFGKHGRGRQDIYHEFIGSVYGLPMSIWSSYRNQPQLQQPVCHAPRQTYAVLDRSITTRGLTLRRPQDRSNIGFVLNVTRTFSRAFCLSDLSRTTQANDRSGVAVCLEGAVAAQQFEGVALSQNNQCRGQFN